MSIFRIRLAENRQEGEEYTQMQNVMRFKQQQLTLTFIYIENVVKTSFIRYFNVTAENLI